MVNGGYYSDGVKEICALNKTEIEDCLQEIRNDRISNIVVSGIFSAVNNTQELQVNLYRKEMSN